MLPSTPPPHRGAQNHQQPTPQRISPFRRQQLLVKRLSLSRNQQHQDDRGRTNISLNTASKNAAGSHGKIGSRKRPFLMIAPSSPTINKFHPTTATSATKARRITTMNIDEIDEFDMWEELSNFLPMLSYGEESKDLISYLLDLPTKKSGTTDAEAENEGGIKTTYEKCKGVVSDECTVQEKREKLLSNLSNAVEHMLHSRTRMRHVAHQSSMHEKYMKQEQGDITNKLSTPTKKAKLEGRSEQKPQSSAEMLPWNVLLRITIRMASSVAKQYHALDEPLPSCCVDSCCKCEQSTQGNVNDLSAHGSACKRAESEAAISKSDDVSRSTHDTTKSSATMHPILQVLDIVLAGLHVTSRMQQSEQSGKQLNTMQSPIKTEGKLLAAAVEQPQKSHLPLDRMLSDWQSKPQPNSFVVYWGPSRHAMLRDIESITKIIESDGKSMMLGINSEEWHEKIQTLIAAMDDCVRGHRSQMSSLTPQKVKQQQPALAISPSLRRYDSSPSKTASIASIARSHVERVGSKRKAERKSCRSEPPPTTNFNASYSDAGSVALNLQSVMDQEGLMKRDNADTNIDVDQVDTDELVDVYRMAIAVGSSFRLDNELTQEMLERRLSLLVKRVIDTQNQNAHCDNLNLGGAQSFLESLLRTLVQPSDLEVWLRLMKKSQGQETPIMLRRGRTILACFLIEIKAPGWEDCIKKLESSPVPSYLGYLSPHENFTAATTKEEIMKRSSYFLPAVEKGETTLPASPIVTEIGLGLCMKNYLHKDTPEGRIQTSTSNNRSSGVSLFRNYGPLQYQHSSSKSNGLSDSIMSPLPNANELTRDLFDLTLRLAADEDDEHSKKPCALRLSTPSPSESINIVLKVLEDYADWLSPRSIIQRYRFILQHLIQSLSGFGSDPVAKSNTGADFDDDDFDRWSQRVSYLTKVTNTAGQGRIALYATQFMTILCSRRNIQTQQEPYGTEQPHFYDLLQLGQPSPFWNEIDRSPCCDYDYSSNLLASVFNLNFCESYLLPLSFHCSLLLANTPLQDVGDVNILSLLTILCSVLDVLADNGALDGCVCAGWALQMLSYSVNYFLYGDDNIEERESLCDSLAIKTSSDSMWNSIAYRLNRLCFDVWGKLSSNGQYLDAAATAANCVYYEHLRGRSLSSKVLVLMPPLGTFMSSLIQFACNLRSSTESESITSFCQFIANRILDHYANAIQPSHPQKTTERSKHSQTHHDNFSILSSWVRLLVSSLQVTILTNKPNIEQNELTKREKSEEVLMEKDLKDLTAPMVKSLHSHIMQRSLRLNNTSHNQEAPTEHISSIFVSLYKQEVDTFLTKPSTAKTRRWRVYRQCLEKVFALTPPSTLFAGAPQLSLSSGSVVALENIWKQYSQCNASFAISIMFAAAIHVNNSAKCLTAGEQHRRQEMKHLYNKFSTQAKTCITSTYDCFHDGGTNKVLVDESRASFNNLMRLVRRQLSLGGHETQAGLAWWNHMSHELLSMLNKKGYKGDKSGGRQSEGKNITNALSTLQSNLSAITASTHSNGKNSYS